MIQHHTLLQARRLQWIDNLLFRYIVNNLSYNHTEHVPGLLIQHSVDIHSVTAKQACCLTGSQILKHW